MPAAWPLHLSAAYLRCQGKLTARRGPASIPHRLCSAKLLAYPISFWHYCKLAVGLGRMGAARSQKLGANLAIARMADCENEQATPPPSPP